MQEENSTNFKSMTESKTNHPEENPEEVTKNNNIRNEQSLDDSDSSLNKKTETESSPSEENTQNTHKEVKGDNVTPEEEKTSTKESTTVINEKQDAVSDEKEEVLQPVPDPEVSKKSDEVGDTAEQDTRPKDTETEKIETETDQPSFPGSDTTDKDNGINDEEDDDDDEEDEEEEERDTLEDFEKLSKEELVELLEKTVENPSIKEIKTRVALIKVSFLKICKDENDRKLKKYISEGGEETSFEPAIDLLEQRFNQAFEKYKASKAKYIEQQEILKQKNLEEKQKILDQLRDLINSEESLKKTYDDFKDLQEQWKQIGVVPKSENNNLWQNYHFLVEKFFDKVKINKELKDLDLKKNLEKKVELCEKAEELLLETSINKSFKKLQKYHEEWKEIGPVPQDKNDEIWQRFKLTTDKINQRRKDYYQKIQEDQEENYKSKLALCEKAEEIVKRKNKALKDWQVNTKELNELMKIWKSLGPAPKKYNDQVWERFRASFDVFFSEKKEYFETIKEQQTNNYNLKVDLCVQAESLKDSTDWKNTTQELINLQKEWKKIGPVPRKHSNKIWKRFRAACDDFFNSKKEYHENIHKHEEENLKLKEELIEKVEKYEFTDDKNENLSIIKDFQREWMEIGHVPIKEKDRVQNQFREAINKHLDKLKIDAVEITTMNYRTRFESIRSGPGANKIIGRERTILQNKINKMNDDIILWENNIGFLADSKNAQILKKEFEHKINKAKQEMQIMKAKLKILMES